MRPTICSLPEPHYKQNLYTNPKRTAKSSKLFSPAIMIDSTRTCFVQKIFNFKETLSSPGEEKAARTLTALHKQRSTGLGPRQAGAKLFFADCSRRAGARVRSHVRRRRRGAPGQNLAELGRRPGWNQPAISVKIRVPCRSFNTRASGVFPDGASESRKACSLPAPDASTQTSRAAAMAA